MKRFDDWIDRREIQNHRNRMAAQGLMTYPDGSLTEESEQIVRAAQAVRMGRNMSIQDQYRPMGCIRGIFVGLFWSLIIGYVLIHLI